MSKTWSRFAVLLAVALAAGCSDSALPLGATSVLPATETSNEGPSAAPPPRSATFPEVSQPARIYGPRVMGDWYTPHHGSELVSRYVLYDDGSFALQYSRHPLLEYRGTYTEADGHVVFEWEGWSLAGPWGATGTLTADALAVRYNVIMILTDFEDGVYPRFR